MNIQTDQGLILVSRTGQETTYTWTDILERSRKTANLLQDKGVTFGKIASLLYYQPALNSSMYSLAYKYWGPSQVPLYPPLRLEKLDTYIERTIAMLNAVDGAMLVSNRRVSKILGRVLEGYQPKLGSLNIDSVNMDTVTPIDTWNPSLTPDDLAMAQFSSGTTVAPKPVGLT